LCELSHVSNLGQTTGDGELVSPFHGNLIQAAILTDTPRFRNRLSRRSTRRAPRAAPIADDRDLGNLAADDLEGQHPGQSSTRRHDKTNGPFTSAGCTSLAMCP